MFRLFFLMTLAIFLAVSFGTSQNNSSHQVTSKRQIIQYCTFGAVNYSDCSREQKFNIECDFLNFTTASSRLYFSTETSLLLCGAVKTIMMFLLARLVNQ